MKIIPLFFKKETQLPNHTQYKMDNLNTLVTNKEIEFAIVTIPEKRNL